MIYINLSTHILQYQSLPANIEPRTLADAMPNYGTLPRFVGSYHPEQLDCGDLVKQLFTLGLFESADVGGKTLKNLLLHLFHRSSLQHFPINFDRIREYKEGARPLDEGDRALLEAVLLRISMLLHICYCKNLMLPENHHGRMVSVGVCYLLCPKQRNFSHQCLVRVVYRLVDYPTGTYLRIQSRQLNAAKSWLQ